MVWRQVRPVDRAGDRHALRRQVGAHDDRLPPRSVSRATSARTYFLHKLVGTGKARELYFTAEILNVEQMEKLGLVNRVIEDDKLESETMAFAKKLAAGPRVAWWHVKRNMKVAEEGTLAEALDSEAARQIRTGETEDHKEAARAFVEKRAPVFKATEAHDSDEALFQQRLAVRAQVRIVLAEKGLAYEADINDAVRPISQALSPTLAIPVLDDGPLRLWNRT